MAEKEAKKEARKAERCEEESESSLFWADQIAQEVKERAERDPALKKIVNENGYIVYDEKTPSGIIHVGSGRGWVIHDAIAKSMKLLGLKARFILSSDDMDPYDKPNKDLPASWDKYLGMPFRNMPSPVEGYDNFGDYYFKQVTEKFEEFGIDAELESTGACYESGRFNKAIKTILDNNDKVKAIFERIYDKPYDKISFNPICEKCGKIATTRSISWDKKKELIRYKCEENLVKWAKGCGHEGDISPYNGNGKLPWKVEWAAKWPSMGVVCEFAGKDHFTKGASRDVAIAISDEVLDYPPPYPSTRTTTGKGYEFFTVGGKKMSTSKGTGISFAEVSKYLSPRIIRYLLVRTRPHTSLDFMPEGRNDLILLYDRYDYTERVYFKKEDVEEKEYNQQKRIYELSHIGEIPKKMPLQIPLVLAATSLQIGLNEEGAIKVLRKMKHVPEELSGIDEHHVLERIRDAKNWLERYASDDVKFTVQKEVSKETREKLNDNQRKALHKAAAAAKEISNDKELHNKFYEISQELGLDTKEFFKGAYLVLLNKERGPQLASFVLTLGEKAIRLFENA
jgi:lysyl-tRNA synthetase class 1